ncbi:ATP-binding protein, partial [Curvivirga aplysinae]|uniref:ATP-binding protein n=1 Tax=Curvivirga aplysinae TaxID=2529852 RepID=UPI0012BD6F73
NESKAHKKQSLLSTFIGHINLLPFIIALVLSSLFLYSWQIIKDEDDKRLLTEINGHLQHFSTQIKSHFDSRFALAYFLQEKWANEQFPTQSSFENEALRIHNLYPDFQAINWLDNDLIIKWVVPLKGNEGALRLNIGKLEFPRIAARTALIKDRLITTPPLNLAQGGKGFVGYLPVKVKGDNQGFLNIVFKAEPAVEAAISESFEKHLILNIYDGEKHVIPYTQGLPDPKFTLSQTINVGSREWRLEVSPSGLSTNSLREYLEYFYLIFGLFFICIVSLLIRILMQRQISLKEQEQRFKDLAVISSDWFWELDADLKFSYVSPKYTEVTGDTIEDKIGKYRWEVGNRNTADTEWTQHLEDMKNRRIFKNFEYAITLQGGEVKHYRLSGLPLFDLNGTFTGYRGSGTDITKFKKSELERQKALHDSEKANLSKSRFLATMSHELRTPLNAILGFSEMIKDELIGKISPKKYGEYATSIHQSGEHLLSLINDILDISAIEEGKFNFNPEEFNIIELTENCIKTLALLAEKKNVSIDFQHEENVASLSADKRALTQIIINLLNNAIKFNKEFGEIFISMKEDLPSSSLIFIIQDTGQGIKKTDIPNVMNPFERGHQTALTTQEGTGLGLTIVKSLVDLHHGHISIESEVNKGTIVTVKLPLKQ